MLNLTIPPMDGSMAAEIAAGDVTMEQKLLVLGKGDSAYESALKQGFVGSLDDWLAYLRADATRAEQLTLQTEGYKNDVALMKASVEASQAAAALSETNAAASELAAGVSETNAANSALAAAGSASSAADSAADALASKERAEAMTVGWVKSPYIGATQPSIPYDTWYEVLS